MRHVTLTATTPCYDASMLRTSALALLVTLAGCMVHLSPMRVQTGIPGVVDVSIRKIDGDVFKLDVYNASPDSMVIQRDAITLHEPRGIRMRMQGGIGKTYVVPPGGRHAVNVRFDLAKLTPGDSVQLFFDGAFIVGPGPVQVPPIELSVQ